MKVKTKMIKRQVQHPIKQMTNYKNRLMQKRKNAHKWNFLAENWKKKLATEMKKKKCLFQETWKALQSINDLPTAVLHFNCGAKNNPSRSTDDKIN